MKYDADEASPSTWMLARRAVARCPRGIVKRCQPSRSHDDAEARQQVQRDLDVGLGDQLALDLDRRRRRAAPPAAAPAAARSGTGSRRRRARGSAAASQRAAVRRAGAAAGSPRLPEVVDAAAQRRSASTRSPIGRSCMRAHAAAARSRRPAWRPAPPARRSAGASPCRRCRGRAAPACTASRPPRPVTRSASPSRSMRAAERAQRVEHHLRVVGVEQVVHDASCLRSGRPAAARGWRCSSSRAGAPCRRRDCSGGRSRKAGREHRARGADARLRAQRHRSPGLLRAHLPAAARVGGACGSGLPAPRRCRLASRARAHRACAESAATASGSLRGWTSGCRARRSGSLAAMRVKSRKPGPASDRKSRPAGCLATDAEVGEGQQVRQVAHGGEGGVVVLGRHLQHLRADRRPDVGGLLHQLRRRSAAAASGSPGGRCRARHRRARCRRLPCRRSDAPARSEAMRSFSTRRAASTTSRLVEPTSMNSTPGSTRWRIALKVASVAATGTAISTMSEPETASSADSAATSMTPSLLAPSRWSTATCCSRRRA